MDRHFSCTACGKCCVGLVPLLLDEAIEHAGRFPLAMVWTVVPANSKAFKLSARIGTTVKVARRREIAVQITPMAYIPESLPCPERGEDNLCRIHASKPLRCRTMPLYPYQEEDDQNDLLVPRPGWACDVSAQASLIYADNRILHRQDFDQERQQIERQAQIIKPYADRLTAQTSTLISQLEILSKRPGGGRLALSFTGILPRLPDVDTQAFAQAQLPVLQAFAALTEDQPAMKTFHQHYQSSIRSLELSLGQKRPILTV